MIFHVYSSYVPQDADTKRRFVVAQETWKKLPWIDCPVPDEKLPRMWEEEGKRLPYIRDVFDFASYGKADYDILVHTNTDILVRSDACVHIACRLQEVDAAYCFRRDFGRLDGPIPNDRYPLGTYYPGHDMTVFRVGWWRHYRGKMPDMILGLEAWDPCIRVLIERTNPQGNVTLNDLIAHERHGSFWENPQNRRRFRGQRYCLKLAKAFLTANGVDPKRHGIS